MGGWLVLHILNRNEQQRQQKGNCEKIWGKEIATASVPIIVYLVFDTRQKIFSFQSQSQMGIKYILG